MRKSIKRLKKEALEACVFRGHDMKRYHSWVSGILREGNYVIGYSSSCKTCGKFVYINLEAGPSDIDIHGEAVALNCSIRR